MRLGTKIVHVGPPETDKDIIFYVIKNSKTSKVIAAFEILSLEMTEKPLYVATDITPLYEAGGANHEIWCVKGGCKWPQSFVFFGSDQFTKYLHQVAAVALRKTECLKGLLGGCRCFRARAGRMASVKKYFRDRVKPQIECSPGGIIYEDLCNKYKELLF